ncbi:YcbK family protein [Pajaroellobacter abortibovis]|nr:DUF882 domain-containing protein [Pajaroellobacter abortibovis]
MGVVGCLSTTHAAPSPSQKSGKAKPRAPHTSHGSQRVSSTPSRVPSRPNTTKKPTTTGYQALRQQWHQATPGKKAPLDERGLPMLVLHAINTSERVILTAASEKGGFSGLDLDKAAHLLREPSTGNQHPIEPRIIDILYQLQHRFHAEEVRIISGYRTLRGDQSNHGKGRAVDVLVPGVKDEQVAQFARGLGFVGVGLYPTSGFVHIDVRDRSYFWVDSSPPGQKSRLRGVLFDLAKQNDEHARWRGEHSTPPLKWIPTVDN